MKINTQDLSDDESFYRGGPPSAFEEAQRTPFNQGKLLGKKK